MRKYDFAKEGSILGGIIVGRGASTASIIGWRMGSVNEDSEKLRFYLTPDQRDSKRSREDERVENMA